MTGLITLLVYNSSFIFTEDNKQFELNTDTFDEFSFEEIKGELEDNVNITNISNEYLRDEEIAPLIISAYRKLQPDKRMTDVSYMLLMG